MLRFASELKQQAILYGGHELYRSADLLKKSGTPVLVNLRWPERDRDADPELTESMRVLELREKAPSAPSVLAKAGVKFAFYSGTVERPADLRRAAKRAIDAGLPVEDAVRAFTLTAAEIYGMADRIGSIEKGKIANLVVTDGDLFADATKIKYVIVDGVKYEPTVETPDSAGERTENE
jgi:imidazolonepropionase-like amidohydrolase